MLQIPFRDATVEHQLLIGQTTYTDVLVPGDKDKPTTQIKLRPVLLFGVVPGFGDLLPGWLVGYLIIVIPLVLRLKWAFSIY